MLNHQEDRNQRNLQDYCFSGKGKKIPKRSSSFQCNERDFKYCFCHDVQRRLRLCNMAKKAMKLHHIICLCSTFLQASLPYFTFSLCIIALFVKLLDITVTLLPCKYNICMWIFLGWKCMSEFIIPVYQGNSSVETDRISAKCICLHRTKSRGWVKNET